MRLVWTLALGGVLLGQATPAFEVASVKLDPYDGQGNIGIGFTGNRLHVQHQSLGSMVIFAYGVEDYQVSGGPAWVHSRDIYGPDVYEVMAKAEGDAAPTEQQFRQMLQTLLAERFQLRIHREMKELPAYELVVAKNGPKVKPAAGDAKAFTNWRAGRLSSSYSAKKTSMATLAWMLKSQVERPVIDKTGLTGSYDFDLTYAPGNPSPAEATAPSIFTAVQEQLGLKLESTKASFPLIVVDSAERPSGN